MMSENNFNEKVMNWYQEYVEEASEEQLKDLAEDCEYADGAFPTDTEELRERLADIQDCSKFIWEHTIGAKYQTLGKYPDSQDFLKELFVEAAKAVAPNYDFAEDFAEDMAYHAAGYDDPIGFFKDLAYGGCASGMVGMLIYNDQIKKIYVEHIDSFEDFILELEGEMGEPLRNEKELPHYTWVTWIAYEELAHRIVSYLWEAL